MSFAPLLAAGPEGGAGGEWHPGTAVDSALGVACPGTGTTSEFVRRRIADDDLEEHRVEIEAFLTAIETAGPSIMQKLDAAISTATSMAAAIEALDAEQADKNPAAE